MGLADAAFDRSMEGLQGLPEDAKLLALPPSALSAPADVLDAMRPDAPLLLGSRLAVRWLLTAEGERQDFGAAVRALFRGVDVVADPLAVHVGAGRRIARGLLPGRIRLLVLPRCVEEIAAEAFAGWGALEELAFEEDSGLRAVEDGAFRGSGLVSFAAPASLRTVGREAFANCRRLRHLALNAGLKVLGERCFAGAGLAFVAF